MEQIRERSDQLLADFLSSVSCFSGEDISPDESALVGTWHRCSA